MDIGSGENRKRRIKRFKKNKDAESWMSNLITEREEGTMVNPDDVTIAEFF